MYKKNANFKNVLKITFKFIVDKKFIEIRKFENEMVSSPLHNGKHGYMDYKQFNCIRES